MTSEEKSILLKDLCARLPYHPILKYGNYDGCDYELESINSSTVNDSFPIEDIKPYLRPMSSMTGVEVLEYINLKESIVASDDITYSFETYESIDWLNENHFDYRGLIEKGLALEAHKDMYNVK